MAANKQSSRPPFRIGTLHHYHNCRNVRFYCQVVCKGGFYLGRKGSLVFNVLLRDETGYLHAKSFGFGYDLYDKIQVSDILDINMLKLQFHKKSYRLADFPGRFQIRMDNHLIKKIKILPRNTEKFDEDMTLVFSPLSQCLGLDSRESPINIEGFVSSVDADKGVVGFKSQKCELAASVEVTFHMPGLDTFNRLEEDQFVRLTGLSRNGSQLMFRDLGNVKEFPRRTYSMIHEAMQGFWKRQSPQMAKDSRQNKYGF